ncbi:hypothetical protein FB451DRAFT_1394195 [Mycena latifolia]|nr:hypothetical protein FB451DRAFT_1394195 [Mycena latifolia]
MLLLKKSSLMIAAMLSVSIHFQAASALGAYFCNDVDWSNDCVHWTGLGSGDCYTLDAGHQDAVSSFGPDSGTTCKLYSDYDCTSSSVTLNYPGSSDLRNLNYPSDYHCTSLSVTIEYPGSSDRCNVNYPEAPVNGPGAVNDNMNSFECFAS